MWLFILLTTVPACALEIEAESSAELTQTFKDPSASGRKCVAGDITRHSGVLWERKLKNIYQPGLYRALFYLRMSTTAQPISKSFRGEIVVGNEAKTFSYLNFGETNRYQPLTLEFILYEPLRPELRVVWSHNPELYKKATGDTVAKTSVQDLAGNLLEETEAEGGDDVLSELRGGLPLQQAGKLYLALDKVLIEPLSTSAIITEIFPEKIHYEPSADTWAEVTLYNFTDRKLHAELTLDLLQALEESQRIDIKKVPLEPRTHTKLRFKFNVGDKEFGRELRATVKISDRVVHQKSEYFGVSRQVWQVAICGKGGGPNFGKGKYAPRIMLQNRRSYANWFECFAWAPSDYDDMTPETEEFWSGQTQYHQTIADLKMIIDEAHKHGIKAVSYGKACGGGLPAYETLRKHPDWFFFRRIGYFIERGPDVDFLDRWRLKDYSYRQWQGLWVNSRNSEVPRYGAEEIIRSADMFGWDGVRWDGHFTAWGENADELSAQNTSLVKEIVSKKYPNFLWGYNYGEPQYSDKKPIAFKIPRRTSNGFLKDFEECCSDGGLLMNEAVRDYSNRNFSHAIISIFGEALALEADWVHQLGGYYLCIAFDSRSELDQLYNHLFFFSAGARPYNITSSTVLGNFFRYATRYSAYIYDNSRRRISKPEKFFSIESDETLWWKPYLYLRKPSPKKREVILHIISRPGCRSFNDLNQPPPPLRRNLSLTFYTLGGWKVKKLWQVSPVIEGYQRRLDYSVRADAVDFKLPTHWYYSMIIVELEQTGNSPSSFPLTDPAADARRFHSELKRERKRPAPQKPPAPPTPDSELLKKSKLEPPPEVTLLRNARPDFLFANGVYHWMYRLPEAIGWLGGGYLKEAKVRNTGGIPPHIAYFPTKLEDFLKFDVIILNNAPARWMKLDQRLAIKKFVEAGGGLLVIGGSWSLERGGFQGTFLEELLPLKLDKTNSIIRNKGGWVLQPAPSAPPAIRRLDWNAQPRAFFIHDLPPKQEAKVLVRAGSHPILITGSYGRGRVAVFSANTHGAPPEGTLPFWEWEGLRKLCAWTLRWLSEGYDSTYEPPAPVVDREKLLESLVTLGDEPDLQRRDKVILELCSACDSETADAVIGTLASGIEISPGTYRKLRRILRPYITKEMLPNLLELAKIERNPEANILGVSLLGLAGGKDAVQTIREFLDHSNPAMRRSAIRALGDTRDPSLIPLLLRKLSKFGTEPLSGEEQSTDAYAGLVHDLVIALLKCGHRPALSIALDMFNNAVAQARAFEMERLTIWSTQWGTAFKLTRDQRRKWINKMKRAGMRRDWWRREAQFFDSELQSINPEWVGDIIEKAQSFDSAPVVSLATRTLSPLKDPALISRLLPLLKARSTVIRTVALKKLLLEGSAQDKASAGRMLIKLGSSSNYLDRLFCSHALLYLDPAQRKEVFEKLSKDPEWEVRDAILAQSYLLRE